jgi:hypothetical protein
MGYLLLKPRPSVRPTVRPAGPPRHLSLLPPLALASFSSPLDTRLRGKHSLAFLLATIVSRDLLTEPQQWGSAVLLRTTGSFWIRRTMHRAHFGCATRNATCRLSLVFHPPAGHSKIFSWNKKHHSVHVSLWGFFCAKCVKKPWRMPSDCAGMRDIYCRALPQVAKFETLPPALAAFFKLQQAQHPNGVPQPIMH